MREEVSVILSAHVWRPMLGHWVSWSEWNPLQATRSTGGLVFLFFKEWYSSISTLFSSLRTPVPVVPILQSTASWSGFPLFLNILFDRARSGRNYLNRGLKEEIPDSLSNESFRAFLTKICLIRVYQGLDHIDSLSPFCLSMEQDYKLEGTAGNHFIGREFLGRNMYYYWIKCSSMLMEVHSWKCRYRSCKRSSPSRDCWRIQNVPELREPSHGLPAILLIQ